MGDTSNRKRGKKERFDLFADIRIGEREREFYSTEHVPPPPPLMTNGHQKKREKQRVLGKLTTAPSFSASSLNEAGQF